MLLSPLYIYLLFVGAMFVGSMVSLIIYGISCLQCYFYYLNYPGDELHIKMLVLLVWVLDSLHVAFSACFSGSPIRFSYVLAPVCHAMYHYLITGYGVPKTLEYGTWCSHCLYFYVLILTFFRSLFVSLRQAAFPDICSQLNSST